ncbi:hypothetical protein D9757_000375 [Collybiopsis confluens]|uniref:Uncharacterized protein n=1 Tax=Collybiopsis confluens TaxID=2823264 RepID=A0A8H5MI02_9AGAR|nr:hypothetical protein D9757_000375 [Collybiopsis confluens]
MELKPTPYRPFKWGPHYTTMGIRDMPWDEWIELDNQMQSFYYIKKHRIATRGNKVVKILPDRPGIVRSARHSAIELVHELSDYMSKRFPDAFTVKRAASGHILSINLVLVGETLDLPPPLAPKGSTKMREVSIPEAEEAMRVAAMLTQDDLILMVEGFDGRYYFQGGAVCVSGFWRMRDKIGLTLDEIHIQGHVPQYEEKLQQSMDRYFRRLAVEKPISRVTYFFQVIPQKSVRAPLDTASQSAAEPVVANDSIVDPEELAWSVTTNGNEESFVHGHPISPDNPPVVRAENLRLRGERQSLRRLPLSGAIAFTVRTYLVPLEDIAKEPGVPARMANTLRNWPEDVRKYKENGLFEDVMLEFLDRAVEKQRMEGGEAYVKDPGQGYPF